MYNIGSFPYKVAERMNNMKPLAICSLGLVIIILLSACTTTTPSSSAANPTPDTDIVTELMDAIDSTFNKSTITQAELDQLFAKYDTLSTADKNRVSNYSKLEKYRNVDVDKINTLQARIDSVKASESFSTLIEIYNDYNGLSIKEQPFVDIGDIEQRVQLSNLDKAAIAACQYIRSSLKSSGSFKLLDVRIIDDLGGSTKYYLVNIKYSATNGFGAAIDSNSFQTISEKFENPWYGLGLLTGNVSTALTCNEFVKFYLLHDETPTVLDCEKIMYYIDTTVN